MTDDERSELLTRYTRAFVGNLEAREGLFRIVEVARPAGYFEIGGAHGWKIAVPYRPRLLARVFARWLLGWRWLDQDPRR